MRSAMTALVAATAAALTASASATLTVLTSSNQPASPSQADVWYDPATDGWHITLKDLYAPSDDTLYTIIGNGGETINELIIDVPCWEGPDGDCVPAGSPVIVRVLSQNPGGIHTIHNIQQTGDAETLLTEVYVTHDIGSIEVEAMGIIKAGRDIHGPVVATTDDNPGRGITVLEAQRDLLADVHVPQGKAEWIHGMRKIGTPDDPVSIEAKYNILDILGPDGIYANVHAGINNGDGYTWRLKGAIFEGSLITKGIGWVPHNGGMFGRIEVTDAFEGEVIFRSDYPDPKQWIQLPADGFSGQFIINYDNESSLWNAPFAFGADDNPDQFVIDSPGYPQTPDQLGGGSIGLVPFALHDEACVPVNGASGTLAGVDQPLVVRLRHYGPVALGDSTPVVIERRPAGSTQPYETIASNLYSTQIAPDDPNTLLIMPATTKPVFVEGDEYRINATASLQCNVPSLTPVQWDGPYAITIVESSCPGDLNGDAEVGVSDLLILLSQWGPAGDDEPADIIENGMVDVADLLELLANWGPCGSSDGPIIFGP